ncbi:MAG: rane protein [Mycobacterium sp.]|nr:rane protein [Mycobacterium sp.]
MTAATTTAVARWRTWRWVALALIVIAAIATVGTYLTAPRPGGHLDAGSTSPDGAHALVALLRDRGVDVVVAANMDDVQREARADTLVVVAQTFFMFDDAVLRRLAAVPGDRLLLEPVSSTREQLAPAIRIGGSNTLGGEPNCDLREATRAGSVQFSLSDTYEAATDVPVTRCYGGAVVRYRDGDRTVTVAGTGDFMTNSGLLKEGNAALAMNLAGGRPRMIWYAPQSMAGRSDGAATISDLIPEQVTWIAWQLSLVVLLVALWKGRRVGPLVAEELPVVVRASETVEGRGRLYRSRRARDRAADALRTATLQRLLPRLGLGHNAAAAAVAETVAQRSGASAEAVHHTLFGPPPATDADLVNLAHELDNIERQVAHS